MAALAGRAAEEGSGGEDPSALPAPRTVSHEACARMARGARAGAVAVPTAVSLPLKLYTVVAIIIRTSNVRMGLFNDDRLAGQFILRMDLS